MWELDRYGGGGVPGGEDSPSFSTISHEPEVVFVIRSIDDFICT